MPRKEWAKNLIAETGDEAYEASKFLGGESMLILGGLGADKAWRLVVRAGRAGAVDEAARTVESWLEDVARPMKRSPKGDPILMNKDGTLKFRMDLNPVGDKPHFHIEKLNRCTGDWEDAGPLHRYYFEGDK